MTPVLAVGGIAIDSADRVLLIQRGRDPGKGLWTVPGGRVEHGEKLVDALRREFREELAIEIDVGPLVCAFEHLAGPHFVILDYLVLPHSDAVVAGDDAADARWLTRSEVELLPTTDGLGPVLDRAWEMRA